MQRRQCLQALLALGASAYWSSLVWAKPSSTVRIISLGGTVTELLYALGQQGQLIATDASSLYPLQATALPQVGYYRSLSVDGLLSLEPTLVLASEHAGPPTVMNQLANLGIQVERLNDEPTIKSLYARISRLGEILSVQAQAQALQASIQQQLTDVQAQVAQQAYSEPPKVAVIMQRTHQLHLAGQDTVAALLLQELGWENLGHTHTGYKPVSKESLIALQPDLLIIAEHSVSDYPSTADFLEKSGLRLTPAGQNQHVLLLDDLLLLGLGPRFPVALSQLLTGYHALIAA